MKGEVDDAAPLEEVHDLLSGAIDDVCHLVCDDKLLVLNQTLSEFLKLTWAAKLSPMKRPSLILIAPIMSSGMGWLIISICYW